MPVAGLAVMLLTSSVLQSRWSAMAAVTCTESDKQNCMEEMDQFTFENMTAIVPYHNETELLKVCRTFDKDTRPCLERILLSCDPQDQQTYRGIIDAYAFLCVEERDEYLKHQQCFDNQALHIRGEECVHQFKATISYAKHMSQGMAVDHSCRMVNGYLDCVSQLVTAECGADAAGWQRRFDEKVLEPTLTAMACYKNKDGSYLRRSSVRSKSDSMMYILIALLVGTTLSVLGALVCWFVLRRNELKRQARLRAAQSAHAGSSAGRHDLPKGTQQPYQPGDGFENPGFHDTGNRGNSERTDTRA